MPEIPFSDYEWVLTNSLGSYALGASNLINRRKYHGLLISSDRLFKRTHLLSSLEEKVESDGGSFFLDSTNYTGIVHPDGFKRIRAYFLRPYPCFVYTGLSRQFPITIVKTIKMHPELNIVSVKYANIGKNAAHLNIRPKYSIRDHHSVNAPGRWDNTPFESRVSGLTASFLVDGGQISLLVSSGSIETDFLVFRQASYISEILRGYDSSEDLAAPFKITLELPPGRERHILFSDSEEIPEDAFSRIEKRYSSLPLASGHPDAAREAASSDKDDCHFTGTYKRLSYEEYVSTLEQAFKDFMANDDLVAGFPWFSAWGRDTMISMEAFKFFPELAGFQRRVLLKYARAAVNGVIPNTVGEGGEGANFDTVDASLWFVIRAMEFFDGADAEDQRKLIEISTEVIDNYVYSPDLPFRMDPEDGLIALHPGTNLGLTWMDAKIHGTPVTPRYGKPVEINCLWYSLLKMCAARTDDTGRKKHLSALALKAGASLKSFFDGQTFFDRLSEHGEFVNELRPNYIIGLSLPHTPFTATQIKTGYEKARAHLLTPCGLRSLSPYNPAFRGKYMGSQIMRDLAYHQGTTWVWLLLPLAKTAAKIYKKEKLVNELETMIYFFRDKFMRGEMASIPEIYDGDSPGPPKGAPAQCWSVAAVLAVEKMIQAERR